MKILFLSAWFPFPPINGAKIRIYNLIRQLSKRHEITLLAFSRTIPIENIPEYVPEMEKYCKAVKVVPAFEFNPKGMAAWKGFFSVRPRSVIQTYSSEMDGLIRDAVLHDTYDLVVASEVYAPSLTSLLASRIKGVPKILDALEVSLAKDEFENATRWKTKIRRGLTWLKLQKFTKDMLNRSDACTVPSMEEMKNIRAIVRGDYPVEIIPHSLDLDLYKSYNECVDPNSLVFTGSFTYQANLDAAEYFIEKIYPVIRKSVPDVKFKIIGSLNGVDPEKFPGYESMSFTGLLKDVRPDVAKSWLSIVPLRVGAGTRLKIIESMALGTPVVSTSKGAEGLDVAHGENILIADSPDEFSCAVLSVLRNPSLRQKLSENGKALVAEKYSSEVMGKKFNDLIERIVLSPGKIQSE